MNPPSRYLVYDSKALHLELAARLGFTIPPTLISTIESEIRAFIEENTDQGAQTICKPLFPMSWRDPSGGVVAASTEVITPEHLERGDVAVAPAIYQRRLHKAYEVRVTVIAKSVFSVRLDSQQYGTSQLDWRNIPNTAMLGCARIEAPRKIARMCLAFLDRLGLCFGAFDFIVGLDDRWTFLELNEMGNFLWIEAANPNVPLLDCFCKFLRSGSSDYRYADDEPTSIHFEEFSKTVGRQLLDEEMCEEVPIPDDHYVVAE